MGRLGNGVWSVFLTKRPFSLVRSDGRPLYFFHGTALKHIEELLPWNVAASLQPLKKEAA